ncbi:MAG: Kup system potassium uptake protein, partial [uncultured Sphingomonas sp.]
SAGCCATRKARWNSSSCRPTGWSSLGARSKY